jgi:3-deoxy-D-manno-octulosonic acid kinase
MRDPVREVPRDYVVHRIGETWLVLDRARAEDLIPTRLADPAVRRTLFARAARRGRGAAPSVALGRDLSVVLRRYRHGGMLARLTGTLLWGPGRPLAELAVSARAEAAGAPVPHVLCLAVWRVAGPLWSALIGTREVSDALDLHAALTREADPRERLRLVREVGAAVRRLHDAGVEHNDLQLRNVVVAEDPQRILVVDLDGARFHARTPVAARRRARNLGRLVRSALKLGLRPDAEGRRALAALLAGYTQGDRGLRSALRRWAPWERVKIALHRVGYGLSRLSSSRAAAPPRSA